MECVINYYTFSLLICNNSVMISIVMPAKNAAPYLTACLDSVVQQSYKEWELLVVNDHSTDHTQDILEDFSLQDKRIKVLNNKGNGIIPALQLGYQHAEGSFITRMDADDIMPLNKLNYMVHQLKESGRGHIATGNVIYFAENKPGVGFKKYADWLNSLAKLGNQFSEIYKECVIPSPCWMLYRSDFELIGAFDSKVYPEDYDLVFRMYEQQLTPIPVSEVLHFWRDHKARASRNDPNYADDTFTDLKVSYFFKLHYNKDKEINIWGAGRRGKKLAEALVKHEIPFKWYCKNPEKIGKHIYHVLIEDFSTFSFTDDKQVLVTFSKNNLSNDELNNILPENKHVNKDYFFFA